MKSNTYENVSENDTVRRSIFLWGKRMLPYKIKLYLVCKWLTELKLNDNLKY